ncbi:TIGR03936 family radical SAM-associated protein [Clostridium sp.]|uniref:TIGR03936 family radical SAM-associated protein n=1 Tax=Clostridium sp. TaxID=1506 RepID=UPI003464ADFB
MRYLIKFTKDDSIKFISHLDLLRTLQKIVRRAALPAEYSKGFNPHMSLSIAQPLSVGHYSKGDYMDLILTEDMDIEEVKDRLNKFSNIGIKFLSATAIEIVLNEKRVPKAMALIDAADYIIKVKFENPKEKIYHIEKLLEKDNWEIIKKSKKGEKTVDLKPQIINIDLRYDSEYVIIDLKAYCGSREHLSPELFVNYIKDNVEGSDKEAFTYIERTEMFTIKDGEFIPLYKYE